MFHNILPKACKIAVNSVPDQKELFDTSIYDGIERFSPNRYCEFIRGRACAYEALRALGASANVVPRMSNGLPLWPSGVIGSITHCSGFVACAVAFAEEISRVGIDAEVNSPAEDYLINAVMGKADIIMCNRVGLDIVSSTKLIFSIKEAIFKARFPLQRVWIDFTDIELDIDPKKAEFSAIVMESCLESTISGKYLVTETHVFAAAVELA